MSYIEQLEIVTTKTILSAPFDINTNTQIIAAGAAGIKNKIVGIMFHNNDNTGSNDTVVRIQDGSGGTDLYGGSSGAIYVVGRGGFFGTGQALLFPWFIGSVATAIFLNPVSSKRISGIVYYYQEA